MSSMSLPAFAMTPSTFSVKHPLYCDSIQQSHLPLMSIKTLTSSSPTTKARKSRLIFDFTTEEMARYFHMSQREAAQQLGVATVTIKRNCRRLGIVWPYRLMKSKKNIVNYSTISREDAKRIRQERALERAKISRLPSSRNHCRSRSPSASPINASNDDERAAKAMTMFSCRRNSGIELTEAGQAFARLPLDCMNSD